MTAKAKHSKVLIHANGGPVKGDLSLSVKAEGSVARINLIGTIYSGWTDENFRSACERIIQNGIDDAHVYMNTSGGDVFAANEIVNIIKMFKGKVTGEGGAIVASAGTYIAVHLDKFTMASNGQFMVHKPYAYVSGSSDELRKFADLLETFEADYAQAYSTKTGKSIDDVKALYEKGDYWMSSKVAQKEGFIDGITGEEEISDETKALFAACGKTPPQSKQQQITTITDMKSIALNLGLAADATEEQIVAALRDLQAFKSKYELVEQQRKDAAATAKANRKELVLDELIKNRQIAADAREYYGGQIEASADPEAKIKELQALPKPKSLAVEAVAEGAAAETAGREGWDYAKWAEKDPTGLRAMHSKDYEGFNKLYFAAFGRTAPVFGH
jgi:ATP-dependent Clp protease, protease subunit